MGCGCGDRPRVLDENEQKTTHDMRVIKMNNINGSINYFKAFSNYIYFYQNIFNGFDKKIYLVETDFFKDNFQKLSIDLNDSNINLAELKNKINSENFQFSKLEIKFIITKKDLKTSNIEILNDEILKNLISGFVEYINKDVFYSIKPNKEIDIVLKDSTKITIKKQNFYFYAIEKDNEEKQNSINLNKGNSNQINKLENDEKLSIPEPLPQMSSINKNNNNQINEPVNNEQSKVPSISFLPQINKIDNNPINEPVNNKESKVPSIGFLPQINQKINNQIKEHDNDEQSTVQSIEKISQMSKINQKNSMDEINSKGKIIQLESKKPKNAKQILMNVYENNEYNDEILSRKSDLNSINFSMPINGNLISVSYNNDNLQHTIVGCIDKYLGKDELSKLHEKYETYHKYYKQLFEELDSIDKLLTNSIDPKTYYCDYAIICKNYFNKLIKLFEKEYVYNDENYIIDSYEKLTKYEKIDININQFEIRLKKLLKLSPQLEVESIINTKLKYPKKFVLIKKELLLNFGIKESCFQLNIFKLLFGENYLFIRLKKSTIACSKENIFFNVNYVFVSLNRYYFENDLVSCIQNKGGFNSFFNQIGFDITQEDYHKHMENNEILSEIYLINYKEDVKIEYLKLIILSLSNFTKLTDNLQNFKFKDNDDITQMFIKFISMKKGNFDCKTYKDIINNMLEGIQNYEIERNLNNFQIMLEIVLNELHEKLNSKIIKEDEYPCESKDKNYAFNLYKKNFDEQNESIIKNLFFGIGLNTIIPSCYCNEKNYRCETIKYIYITEENTQNNNNLEDILNNWGVTSIHKYHCKRCNIDCEAVQFKEFKEYPEILIIILNDNKGEDKKVIKFPTILNISKFLCTYKIITVISSQAKNSNFNIVSKDKNNKWIVNDKDNIEKTDIKNINIYLKYPRIIFYEKIDEKEKKLGETQTENDVNKFFEESEKTHSLHEGTRIKHTMEYLNDEESSNGFELFKKKPSKISDLKNNSMLNDDLNINYDTNKILNNKDFEVNQNNINNNIININKFENMNNNMNVNNNMNYENNNFASEKRKVNYNNESSFNLSFNKMQKMNNNMNNNFNINGMYDMDNNMLGFDNSNNINNNINLIKNHNNFNNNNINMYNYNQEFIPDLKFHPPRKDNFNKNNNNDKINLNFTFVTGRECFLTLYDDNITFGNAIYILCDKYKWLKEKNFEKLSFLCNGILLDKNKTIRENGLKNGNIILVVEHNE